MSALVIPVEDPLDPRIGDYVGLRDPDLRVRVEAPGEVSGTPHGRFIAEGALAVERLIGSPFPVRSVLVSPRQRLASAGVLDRLPPATPVFEVTQAVMNAVVGFNIHRGIVASAERLPAARPGSLLAGARRLLVTERVVDHENLGALFRNAAAFGTDAVLLDPETADPLYRRSVRVSMGHVLTTPFARATSWPDGLEALSAAGWRVIALTPGRDAVALDQVEVAAGDRLAVLVGSEGPGLTEVAMAAADMCVRIPLAGGVDSLNVATAAAIALHALAR